jgi:hypothetical protein
MMELTVEDTALYPFHFLPVLQVQRLLPVSRTSSAARQMPLYHHDSQEVPANEPLLSTKRCALSAPGERACW